mgnify:FL=1
MIELKDIYWLAGLVEGEATIGCYGNGGNPKHPSSYRRYPLLRVGMKDKDVVEHAAQVLGVICKGP